MHINTSRWWDSLETKEPNHELLSVAVNGLPFHVTLES